MRVSFPFSSFSFWDDTYLINLTELHGLHTINSLEFTLAPPKESAQLCPNTRRALCSQVEIAPGFVRQVLVPAAAGATRGQCLVILFFCVFGSL